jgi:hypothetical protein
MGYACPVCEDPQADAGHLANHLAFTAMLHEGAHADWLDAHVTDWAEYDEAALAEAVVDHATETEYPQVFEDTTGEAPAGDHADNPHASHGHGDHEHASHGHGDHEHASHGHGDGEHTLSAPHDDSHGGDPFDAPPEAYGVETPAGADPAEGSDIMKQARELTERRRSQDGDTASDADAEGADAEGADAETEGADQRTDAGGADAGEEREDAADEGDVTSGEGETE